MNADLYKISSKRNDKWWSWGNVKKRDKGYGGGIKKTPEFMAWVNETPDGGFLNFLLFEDKPKSSNKSDAMQDGNTYEAAKSKGYMPDDSDQSIPF